MYWVNTMVQKLSFIEPTPKVRLGTGHTGGTGQYSPWCSTGCIWRAAHDTTNAVLGAGPGPTTSENDVAGYEPCSSTFCIDNYYCCACSKTSISINKYLQKAGEPENDAGFLKHIYIYIAS